MTGMVERFCPGCGAERQRTDKYCHRCGGQLPPAGAESAPVAAGLPPASVERPAALPDQAPAGDDGLAPKVEEVPPGRADFFLNPARLFARGKPPAWGIALALVVLTGLGSGAVGAVAAVGLERMLPNLIAMANLPAEISDQLVKSMAFNNPYSAARPGGMLLGLAYAIPKAIAGLLIAAGIFFGLGRWAGGKGNWESFTRYYALLAIPEIPTILGNLVAATLLLLSAPAVVLLVAGGFALLASTLTWAWKIWLRYALLTGNMRLSAGRAGAIVAGWEALRLTLILLLVVMIFFFGVMLAVAGQGA